MFSPWKWTDLAETSCYTNSSACLPLQGLLKIKVLSKNCFGVLERILSLQVEEEEKRRIINGTGREFGAMLVIHVPELTVMAWQLAQGPNLTIRA